MASRSNIAPGHSGFVVRTGTAAVWSRMWRTRVFTLPLRPYSGQYSMTYASGSTSPRSISMLKQIAVMPFATDIMQTVVGASQGTVIAALRQPPQTSTTVRPSSTIEQAAPTSSSASKFSMKASTTRLNSGAYVPPRRYLAPRASISISSSMVILTFHGAGGLPPPAQSSSSADWNDDDTG